MYWFYLFWRESALAEYSRAESAYVCRDNSGRYALLAERGGVVGRHSAALPVSTWPRFPPPRSSALHASPPAPPGKPTGTIVPESLLVPRPQLELSRKFDNAATAPRSLPPEFFALSVISVGVATPGGVLFWCRALRILPVDSAPSTCLGRHEFPPPPTIVVHGSFESLARAPLPRLVRPRCRQNPG